MPQTVYVISKNGKPLMPTARNGHIGYLLRHKKARIVRMTPFTIQLLYETEEKTQPIVLGIDPGRTNIGLSAVTETGESVFQGQVEARNKDIPKLMQKRSEHRRKHRSLKRRRKRQRRARKARTTVKGGVIERKLPGCEKLVVCKEIRNKEARFMNRKRPTGWLTPTARHLKETHLQVIRELQKFLPITDVSLEVNKFAFMQMEDPSVSGEDFQNGPLKGFASVQDFVYQLQKGQCLLCRKPIEIYHRVISKSNFGSETLYNRVGLCAGHHQKVCNSVEWEEKLKAKADGLAKKYGALSVLNQIFPQLINELKAVFPEHVHLTNGEETKFARDLHHVEKDHHLDAYCIAMSALETEEYCFPKGKLHRILQYRRHDRQALHKENSNRVYLLDGKPVAKNRHKSLGQKDDSLEEFRSTHSEKDVSRLTVRSHTPQYRHKGRALPGSIFRDKTTGKTYVLDSTNGRHDGKPDYFIDPDGKKHYAKNCIIIQKNKGLRFAD